MSAMVVMLALLLLTGCIGKRLAPDGQQAICQQLRPPPPDCEP